MAYTLTTTTIKPTATAWYSNSGSGTLADQAAYQLWLKANTGFIATYSVPISMIRPAGSSFVALKIVSVWDSIAHYNAFVAARATQSYYIAQQAYNLANGIISTDFQTHD